MNSINKIINLVSNEVNEEILIREGRVIVKDINRNLLNKEDNEKLNIISTQLDLIERFLDEQYEFEDIETKEQIDEAIASLSNIYNGLKDLAVSKRVSKEIRGLRERKPTMPLDSAYKKALALKRLNSHAPKCKYCEVQMELRQGEKKYFWGCVLFPECHNKVWLKKNELDLIAKYL